MKKIFARDCSLVSLTIDEEKEFIYKSYPRLC